MNMKEFEVVKSILSNLRIDMNDKKALKIVSGLSKINL